MKHWRCFSMWSEQRRTCLNRNSFFDSEDKQMTISFFLLSSTLILKRIMIIMKCTYSDWYLFDCSTQDVKSRHHSKKDFVKNINCFEVLTRIRWLAHTRDFSINRRSNNIYNLNIIIIYSHSTLILNRFYFSN
jgi:hypothetical protein